MISFLFEEIKNWERLDVGEILDFINQIELSLDKIV